MSTQKLLSLCIAVVLVSVAALNAADIRSGAEAGEKMTLTVNGIDYTFCWCPAGEFTMGSPASETDRDIREHQHRVALTEGFWLLECEVTQEMWTNVMGTSVRDQCAKAGGRWVTAAGSQFPIYYVDWDESNAFCTKLSALSGYKVTLPTEAQWEYACRAGTGGKFAGTGSLNDMGWFTGNSDSKAHEVKTKQPNAWGLYDMHGNVYEWCSDWYGDYTFQPVTDPEGAEGGLTHVYRGGCWDSLERACRSAHRIKYPANRRLDYTGFRIAIVPSSNE